MRLEITILLGFELVEFLAGFPEYVYDNEKLNEYYTNLDICAKDHFGNSQKIRTFNLMKNYEAISKPRERKS